MADTTKEKPTSSLDRSDPRVARSIVITRKEKDPKRVEAGKRLAAISKQAKEKKRKEREHALHTRLDHFSVYGSATLMIGLTAAGVVAALATLWYTRKDSLATVAALEEPSSHNQPVPKIPTEGSKMNHNSGKDLESL